MTTKIILLTLVMVLGLTGCVNPSANNSTNNSTQQTAPSLPVSDLATSASPEYLYPRLPADVVPELAQTGKYDVGVRTIDIVNPAQFDVLTKSNKDRLLKVEIWYPTPDTPSSKRATYDNQTRSGISFSLQGKAYRDQAVLVASNGEKYPLIVLSHGYTGYRSIMYYLGEHLASHGYIVAAIDHTDSTNAEVDYNNAPFSGFVSTLLNRSRDQQFTLDNLTTTTSFISPVIDKENAGLIGYSMGGYGAVNTIGGCYSFNQGSASAFTGIKEAAQLTEAVALLNSCAGGQYKNITVDPKWKAAIALAPWGGQHQLFSVDKLASITTPVMYIAGSLDDVSGYAGITSLYKHTGSDHAYLLTYDNARHNIAPHPAPLSARSNEIDIGHYYDATWSNVQLNNINKHFALAMMDCHIKDIIARCEYLDLSESSNQTQVDGKLAPVWQGFDNRYATGMHWRKKS